MPGTPMDQGTGGLAKLQADNPQNEEERRRDEADEVEENQQGYRPDPSARELTQTDRLNKRLLESLLERMSKSEGEFDRFMDEEKEEEEPENHEEASGKF